MSPTRTAVYAIGGCRGRPQGGLSSLQGDQPSSARRPVVLSRYVHGIDELIERNRVPTLDFATGSDTERRYSRAKVIDMIFFVEGSR